MRGLAALLALCVSLAGCALFEPRPVPLTKDDVVRLAKSGESAASIIDKLKATDTVILLSASEIVRLHDAGVPSEVLDWLQRTQIDELRWRERYAYMYGYGPFGRACTGYRPGWWTGGPPWSMCY